MSSQGDGGFAQGRSAHRPPLFVGNNFAHWKSLMKMFVIDQDLELWDIIVKGPRVPMKDGSDGTRVAKSEDEFSQTDLEQVAKNYRAMNLLYCGLDANEFNRITSCKSAKEIWDKLVVTYEGTSQVKETKINIFLRQYELFKMNKDEPVKEMFTRFTQIVNNLDSLGKTFSNEEKVRKVLRCLPKGKWGPKVTAIEEAQDLKRLQLDDLLGKLLTHELTLNEDDGEQLDSMKNLALKAKKEESSSDDAEGSQDDEDPFALVARGLSKILKMQKKYYKPRRYENSKYQRGKSSSKKSNSANLKCFECSSTDHFIKDCPQVKKKNDKSKKDKDKKAMVATWSDSDSSDSESEGEMANICLMAKIDEENDSKSSKVDSNFDSCPKEVLISMIQNMIKNEESLISETNSIREKYRDLISKNVELEIENKDLKAKQSLVESESKALTAKFKALEDNSKALTTRSKALETDFKALKDENLILKQKLFAINRNNDSLKNENVKLVAKVKDQLNALVQFTNSEENLNRLMGQRRSLKKKGIGYVSPTTGYDDTYSKLSKIVFEKASNKNWKGPKCHYCCRIGHKVITCPYKRRDPQTIKNSFPMMLREQVKQVWVVKGTRPPNMVHPEYDSKLAAWSRGKG